MALSPKTTSASSALRMKEKTPEYDKSGFKKEVFFIIITSKLFLI
jgi:hypothetical protein